LLIYLSLLEELWTVFPENNPLETINRVPWSYPENLGTVVSSVFQFRGQTDKAAYCIGLCISYDFCDRIYDMLYAIKSICFKGEIMV